MRSASVPLTALGADPTLRPMTADEVIAEIAALPQDERTRVLDYVHQLEAADIPESFRRGMEQALAGRGVDMETALNEVPPSRRG